MRKTREQMGVEESKNVQKEKKKTYKSKKKLSKRFLFVETIQAYFYCGVKLSVCVFRNCR